MANSLPSSSEDLRRSVVDLLWRQWSALGVAGHVAPGGNAAVDPEALLLVSTVFARHDARLFDEIADWLQQNGDWINLLRMARLQRELGLGDVTVLGALAEHLTQRSAHSKWKGFAKNPPQVDPPAPLFPHLPSPNRTDNIFRRWGWLRTPLESRGLSKPPRTNQPGAFLLQLRALFGMQSRAAGSRDGRRRAAAQPVERSGGPTASVPAVDLGSGCPITLDAPACLGRVSGHRESRATRTRPQ